MKSIRVFLFGLLWVLVGCTDSRSPVSKVSDVGSIFWSTAAAKYADSLWVWSKSARLEKGACLYGATSVTGRVLYVFRAEPPLVEGGQGLDADRISCVHQPDFFGVAHTHPSAVLDLSKADRVSLNAGRIGVLAVICGIRCRRSWTPFHDGPVEETGTP